MKIASIEVRRYRNLWGTPVTMSWDPVPRTYQDAEVVIVTADDGTVGIGGGDNLPDLKLLQRHLVGLDPRRLDLIHRICETVDFHGGRPWVAEAACADLAARAAGEPLWRFLGGRNESLLAYASTAEVIEPAERAERTMHLRMAGFKADVLENNRAMLKVYEKAPFPVETVLSGGVYKITIPFNMP